MPNKIQENKSKGIQNIYHAVVADKDDEIVDFKISNNGQSSSILEFGLHSYYHSNIHWIHHLQQKTITIDTFFEKNNLDPSMYNFWNMDIQGAEYLALQGAKKSLLLPDILYLEVNEAEVYKGCKLITDIDKLLKEYHFTRVQTKMTNAKWGDAIYIKNK